MNEDPQIKEFQSFFKTVEGGEGGRCKYPTRLDTYGCGCSHDCAYCYAKSLLSFRGMWHPKAPSVIPIDKMRRIASRHLKAGDIVRLGGMVDCFMPREKLIHRTYETIKSLNRRSIGYLIVTKSALVANDDYMAIYDPALAHIQVSITSTSDTIARSIEKASLPKERIAAVEKLARAGFDVSVRLSPYIPQFVNIDTINAIDCDKILVEFLRVNGWIRKWMDIDLGEYTHNEGGYAHLPLERKKALLDRVTGFREVSVCEDCEAHYRYWRQNVNANPDDCCNLRLT